MGAIATAVRTHQDHHVRLLRARTITDELFQILKDAAFYERPIAERHRVIFYLGHVEAFDWNLLGQRAFGLRRFHKKFDQLFAFGIDPVGGGLPTDQPEDWPSRAEIAEYNQRLRRELDASIEQALEHPTEGHPQFLTMLDTAIEHRLMHAETLAYMFHRLPLNSKRAHSMENQRSTSRIQKRLVDISAGPATLGLPERDEIFGWDNERGTETVQVPEFSIENHNVTNRQFMHFVENGGYKNRSLWTDAAWAWRTAKWHSAPGVLGSAGQRLDLPCNVFGEAATDGCPVYVSHAEASAYAMWLGRKLPSEAQFHRAAYGVPHSSEQRSYPWGRGAQRGTWKF